MKKKGFTLIEILIAIVIAGILFTLIFRAYVSITQITARLGNEKKLNAEILYVTQTVQNIADAYQIDFAKYTGALAAASGQTDIIYFTGNGTTGTVLEMKDGNIWRTHGGNTTALLSSGAAKISSGTFVIIPFTPEALTGTAFLDVQHPGFWLFAHMQLNNFNANDRIRNVEGFLQQFYNLQRIE